MDCQELKKRRVELGLTQSGLARLLRVSEGSVYRWENDLIPFPISMQNALNEVEARLNRRRRRRAKSRNDSKLLKLQSMAAEKEPIEKIFCLFHQKTGCSCLNPVNDKETLIKRLTQEIKVNDFLNTKETNPSKVSQRNEESCDFRVRLKNLMLPVVFYLAFFDSLVNC